jgi:hypothetical protein
MKTFYLATRAALPLVLVVTFLFTSAWAQDNLARTGTAVQSSDWGAGQFPASLANDGNLGNFTATATGDDMATWEVDLGAPVVIERIVVYNRGGGCCQSRLRDITVSIREFSFAEDPFGDEDPLFESELLNEENELGGGGTGGPPSLTVELDEPITGQFVRVTRLPDPDLLGTDGAGNADEANVLSLGEVVVIAGELPNATIVKTGDVNGDGSFNISDPVAHLGFLFASGPILECYVESDSDPVALNPAGLEILDFNGDGASNIADAVGALNRLFGGGDPHTLGERCAEIDGDCASNCID